MSSLENLFILASIKANIGSLTPSEILRELLMLLWLAKVKISTDEWTF